MIERSQVVYKVPNRRNRWLMCIVCDEVGGLQPSHAPTLLIPRTPVIIPISAPFFCPVLPSDQSPWSRQGAWKLEREYVFGKDS